MPFLADITRRRRNSMSHFCEELPQTEILTRHEKARRVIPVLSALRANPDLAVIAGFMKAEPNGPIAPRADHVQYALDVEAAGADMVLVATEPAVFDGAFEDIHEITQYGSKLPVAALDFAAIGDVFPIFRACGADVAFIIYAGLKGEEPTELLDFCPRAGLTPCMVVFTEEELDAVIKTRAPFVCIAAYNPDTAEPEFERGLAMCKKAKDASCLTVFSCAIDTPEQAQQAAKAGADAVVITKPLMNAKTVEEKAEIIASFKGTKKRPLPQKTGIKIDGVMSHDAALAAADAGADFIGMYFAESDYQVSYEEARAIGEGLPQAIRRVGVFANQGRPEIETAVKLGKLDMADLRGQESVDLMSALSCPIWKKVRVTGAFDPLMVAPFLETCAGYTLSASSLDDPLNLTNTPLDYDKLGVLPLSKIFVLTGGLTPENVADAIVKARPNIVEFRLEPNCTDFSCIKEFVDAVHEADKRAGEIEE